MRRNYSLAVLSCVIVLLAGCANTVTGQGRAVSETQETETQETETQETETHETKSQTTEAPQASVVTPGSITLFEPCGLGDEVLAKAGVLKSSGIPNSTAHGINCVWRGDTKTLVVSAQPGSMADDANDPSKNPQAKNVQVLTDPIHTSWVFVFATERSSVCLGQTGTADGIVSVSVIEHPPLPVDPRCGLVVDMMNLLSPYLPK